MKRVNLISWILVVVMLIIAIIGICFMPDVIAVQWNFDGVSNTAPKWMVFVFPALGALCTALHKSQGDADKNKSIGYFLAVIILMIAELSTVGVALL